MITDERLREIAETVFDDPDTMSTAINELAVVALELRTAAVNIYESQRAQPTHQTGRSQGKPIPPDCRQDTCSRCHEGVVVFRSKRTGNDYLCDAVMGEFNNIRQMLTAPNWLHKCDQGRKR